MLESVHIQNVALIDELDIQFYKGFHVLTGETGAGKSIIIDAVNFLLGERASRDIIKTGASKAFVQASFVLEHESPLLPRLLEYGIPFEEDLTLILSRELTSAGRNTCRVNGVLVNLATIKTISDFLVDVHGQHEHQSLLAPEAHIRFLDQFQLEKIAPLKEAVADSYEQMQALKTRLLAGFPSEKERMQRIDILQYQLQEIASAKLTADEEERLEEELRVLSNALQIQEALEVSYAALTADESGALTGLSHVSGQLAKIAPYHKEYEAIHARAQDAYYMLDDIGYTLRDLKNAFEFQPERLQEVESRLDCLHTLKRKYGATIADVLEFYDAIQAEYDALLEGDLLKEKLQHALLLAQQAYHTHAQRLSAQRKQHAKKLSTLLMKELLDLGMKKATFEVCISQNDNTGPEGIDHVEFLLSTNEGEPVKPLHKVASGGELSRIMLAFKTVYAGQVPTVIFDEIDSGIGGKTAIIVGQKMNAIAKNRQVICVTHLAQIAAQAGTHYAVKKQTTRARTQSTVQLLSKEERMVEIASIMGAEAGDAQALKHAQELLQRFEA